MNTTTTTTKNPLALSKRTRNRLEFISSACEKHSHVERLSNIKKGMERGEKNEGDARKK